MGLELKTHFSREEVVYDGSQLRPLYNYMNFQLEANSLVSWVGPCRVPTENLLDGEDRLKQSSIQADKMLHSILELFHWPLHGAVCFQRMISEQVRELLARRSKFSGELLRRGDDLFFRGESSM